MPFLLHLRRCINLAWQRLLARGANIGTPASAVHGKPADATLAQTQAQLGRALQHAQDSLRVMHRASQGLDVLAKQLPLRRLRRGDRLSGDGLAGLHGAPSRAAPTPGEVGTLAAATLPNVDPAAQVRLLAGSLREQSARLEQALAALQAEATPPAPLQAADTPADTVANTFADEPDRSISRRLAAAALHSAAQAPAHPAHPAPPSPPAGRRPGDRSR